MREISFELQIKDKALNDPFDLSSEKSKDAFDTLVSENPQKVQEIFSNQQTVYDSYQQSGLANDQTAINSSEFVPLAENKYFPGNFHLREKEIETVLSSDTLNALEDFVNNHPEKLLQLNMPNFSDPTPEELTELDEIGKDLEEYATNQDDDYFEKHYARRRTKFQEIDMRQKQAKLTWIRENLRDYFTDQKNLETLETKTAEILYQSFFEASQVCQECIFHQIALTEAVALISCIAPNLKEIAEQIQKEIVLIKNVKRKPFGRELDYWNEQLENFSFTYLEGIPLMTVEKPLHTNNLFEKNHPVRVVVLVHELLHAITDNILQLAPASYTEILKYLKKENGKVVLGQLQRVIGEGISIAFELESLLRIQRSSHDSEVINSIQNYTHRRLRNLIEANRQWSERARTRMSREKEEEYVREPDEIISLAYSEGVRLAIALKRNGWTLNDLPQFLEYVKREVIAETGNENPNAIYSIAVKRNESETTPYQRIIQRIRGLKRN